MTTRTAFVRRVDAALTAMSALRAIGANPTRTHGPGVFDTGHVHGPDTNPAIPGDLRGVYADAYRLGVDAATAAASWIADGNTDHAAAVRVLAMMDDGDPAADDYMPARPTLSGEWADDPTPTSIAYDVCGTTCPQCGNAGTYIGPDGYVSCGCTDNDRDDMDHDPDVIDAIADAWERGVDDTFGDACYAALAAWVA